MRGLDIRANFALAKIAKAIGIDPEGDELWEALQEAEFLGHCDYRSDRPVPILFQDEPSLVKAWESGFDFAAESAEMAECHGCNDGTGNPCPTHG